MQKIFKIVGASALILTFGLFNVGLPVVLYLCPMMSSTRSACPMANETAANGSALLNQAPNCCGKVIIAERNTTPFVKVQQLQQEKILSLAVLTIDFQKQTTFRFDQTAVESPPLSDSPLFLLNSVLLI